VETNENAVRYSSAVAFWGGYFYIFIRGSVDKYSPGETQLGIASLGYDIVGAGVSTCALQ